MRWHVYLSFESCGVPHRSAAPTGQRSRRATTKGMSVCSYISKARSAQLPHISPRQKVAAKGALVSSCRGLLFGRLFQFLCFLG
jgi:hypothetical protein